MKPRIGDFARYRKGNFKTIDREFLRRTGGRATSGTHALPHRKFQRQPIQNRNPLDIYPPHPNLEIAVRSLTTQAQPDDSRGRSSSVSSYRRSKGKRQTCLKLSGSRTAARWLPGEAWHKLIACATA